MVELTLSCACDVSVCVCVLCVCMGARGFGVHGFGKDSDCLGARLVQISASGISGGV